MIKINLLAESKPSGKPKKAPSAMSEGLGTGRNLLLFGLLVIGLVVAGGWWWKLDQANAEWVQKHKDADTELERLAEIRKKGDEYKKRKELLARKIDLITDLKAQQAVPVHILDQVSKNLPDFVWLDRMSANNNDISIGGKAMTYNAVSNFYGNLANSGMFSNVTLGRVFELSEGVSFSLTCQFNNPKAETGDEGDGQSQT